MMIYSVFLLTALMGITIFVGYRTKKIAKNRLLHKGLFGVNILALAGVFFWASNLIIPHYAKAADTVQNGGGEAMAYLSAAIAVGIGCIAAGIAVAITGSSAIGAISEKPEALGRALIFVGLAEGIAIYGLIIAIMILGKV